MRRKMDKKYKVVKVSGKNGYFKQIVALRDIPRHNVKAGDLGGYVHSLETLDQKERTKNE